MSAVFAGNQAIIELAQQQFAAVGVELVLDLMSTPEALARQSSGDFDSLYGNSTRADGDVLRTSYALDGRNSNRRGPIPELDQALAQPLAITDPDERKEVWAGAQRLVLDNGLSIPTIELSQAIGAGPKVHDVKFQASARLQFFDTWVG